MAYYVRYSRAQAYKPTNKDAWLYANKLKCDLDVYDAQERRVVWATYRLCRQVTVDNEKRWEILGYAKNPNGLRSAFAETRPEVWSLSHYDWASKSWTSVKHS